MAELFVGAGGVRLHYRIDGAPGARPLVLLNSIGTDLRSWAAVVDRLAPHCRVLRMDTRGHGASQAAPGDYALGDLAADLAAVMDGAGLGEAVVAGVSLGGMIAMEFALRFPERTEAIVPVCTSASMDRAAWQARIAAVRSGGTAAIAELAMERFFSPEFRSMHPGQVRAVEIALKAMDSRGYAGCAAAIRDMVLLNRLAWIDCPTLVVSGERDESTPFVGHGDQLLRQIHGAQHVAIDCGHLACIEQPEALAGVILDFVEHLQ